MDLIKFLLVLGILLFVLGVVLPAATGILSGIAYIIAGGLQAVHECGSRCQ